MIPLGILAAVFLWTAAHYFKKAQKTAIDQRALEVSVRELVMRLGTIMLDAIRHETDRSQSYFLVTTNEKAFAASTPGNPFQIAVQILPNGLARELFVVSISLEPPYGFRLTMENVDVFRRRTYMRYSIDQFPAAIDHARIAIREQHERAHMFDELE